MSEGRDGLAVPPFKLFWPIQPAPPRARPSRRSGPNRASIGPLSGLISTTIQFLSKNIMYHLSNGNPYTFVIQ